jgi:UDP-glucose 4-epimerase
VKKMQLKNKKVLVTGGAGFIGSHLVDVLLEKGNNVIIYDNFDDFYMGKDKNISHNLNNKKFSLIKGDILDYDLMSSIMKNVDVVFHHAGQAGIRYCINMPEKAHRVNTTGTLNVLLACKKNQVKKIVFASSSSIFGIPLYMPIDEKHPTYPGSFYGATKLAGEKYCLAFHEVYKMNLTCLRYFSVYGPRGRPDQVVYAFSNRILKGEPVIIYGDGSQTRDFTYISDVVDATLSAAEIDEASGEVFNIGYGQEISIKKVLEETFRVLGKEIPDNIEYQKTYGGEFPKTIAENKKAREVLGWKPQIDFSIGLSNFISWFTS